MTIKLGWSSLDTRSRRHHTEPHSLKGGEGAWHMGSRGHENAIARSARLNIAAVLTAFSLYFGFWCQNQSSTRYTELKQGPAYPPE